MVKACLKKINVFCYVPGALDELESNVQCSCKNNLPILNTMHTIKVSTLFLKIKKGIVVMVHLCFSVLWPCPSCQPLSSPFSGSVFSRSRGTLLISPLGMSRNSAVPALWCLCCLTDSKLEGCKLRNVFVPPPFYFKAFIFFYFFFFILSHVRMRVFSLWFPQWIQHFPVTQFATVFTKLSCCMLEHSLEVPLRAVVPLSLCSSSKDLVCQWQPITGHLGGGSLRKGHLGPCYTVILGGFWNS